MRRDVPVAMLMFEANYPESRDEQGRTMSIEVVRLCTSMVHVKRIAEVLAKNVETYEKMVGPLSNPDPTETEGAS